MLPLSMPVFVYLLAGIAAGTVFLFAVLAALVVATIAVDSASSRL